MKGEMEMKNEKNPRAKNHLSHHTERRKTRNIRHNKNPINMEICCVYEYGN